jgi:hypothetical protein
VWGTGANDIFAVGDSGAIAHFDGQHWTRQTSPTTTPLQVVWGTGVSDVYAAGGGALVHYNGTSWHDILQNEPFTLATIWGSGPTDVWVAGGTPYPSYKSVIYHGSAQGGFSPDLSNGAFPAIAGVWASSPTDAWAVGTGTLLHNTGSGWTSFTSTGDTITAIWGSAANRIFALSSRGVLQYGGSGWSIMSGSASLNAGGFLTGVGQDLYAGGGTEITQIAGPTTIVTATSSGPAGLYGVWLSGPGTGWMVGGAGRLVQGTNGTWADITPVTSSATLTGVWGSSASDVIAVGTSGTILQYNGSAWSTVSSPTTANLSGVWGSGSGSIWAVGANGTVVHDANGTWATVTVPTQRNLYVVSGSIANGVEDVWAGGDSGTVLHDVNGTWTVVPTTGAGAVQGLWFSSPTNGWVSVLEDVTPSCSDYYGQMVCAPNDAYLEHYDGTVWTVADSDVTPGQLWGSSPSDIWLAGTFYEYGEGQFQSVFHYDGTQWTYESQLIPYLSYGFQGVWGSGSSDVYMVGLGPIMVHWTGGVSLTGQRARPRAQRALTVPLLRGVPRP